MTKKVEIALKMAKLIHNSCKDVPYDIGIQLMPMLEEYATEFGKFLLENAMFQQRGKLYLKFTDKEIKQIIDNAMKDFENGSTEG